MKSLLQSLKAFYMGKFYPVLVAFLVLLGYSIGWEIAIGIVMLSTLILGLWICDDLRFAVLPFLCTVLMCTPEHTPNMPSYSKYYLEPQVLIPLAITVVTIFVSLGFFVKRNWRNRNPVTFKGIFSGIIVFCGAMLLNGAFSKNYKLADLIYGGSFLLTLLFMTYLFYAFIRIEKGTASHLIYCFAVCGVLMLLQLLVVYLTIVEFVDGSPVKETVVIGWGVWTSVGGMLTYLMPTSFYFAATKRQGWVGYLLGCLSLLGVLLSQSRGALLIGGIVFLACVITLCFVGEYKKRNRFFALGIFALGLIGVAALWGKLMPMVQNFITYGFGDNGRFDMWRTGMNHFLDYPIFGSGFYDSYVNPGWVKNVIPYLYHNTVVQLLASGGVIGFAAYLYHRYTTVMLVVRKTNPCKIFLGISILGLLTFCMLDVLFFHAYPVMFYSIMLVAMLISEKEPA